MNTRTSIEPLESRIAPASVLLYTDVDGDKVKVTSSSATGDLNAAGVATLVDGFTAGLKQLQKLQLGAAFAGTNLTFTVTKVAGGDGAVNVGYIDATGVDLGTVTIKGDLGAIDAGDPANPASACKGLSVQSLGRFGLSTGAPDLESNLDGKLDKLTVKSDVKEAFLSVTDSAGANGKIGRVFIGGSLIGGLAINSGQLAASNGMGFITIKGSILGGFGQTSGAIASTQDVAGVSVGGSLVGGAGFTSGVIFSSLGSIGPVKIGGSVVAGSSTFTGRIFGKTVLASVTVGGTLLGGAVDDTGMIHSDGAIGVVSIKHDVAGGAGQRSGRIYAVADLASVTIGGSVTGGDGPSSGSIRSDGKIGPVTVRGDIAGGDGFEAGRVSAGATLGAVTVGGSVIGADGDGSGNIVSIGDMGLVKIRGDVRGGAGGIFSPSGQVFSGAKLAGVTLGGSLIGGQATRSGQIFSTGDMGPVKIGGSIREGGDFDAGQISSSGKIANVTIAGSIFGGTVRSTGNLGAVKVSGDLRGGNIEGGGFIGSGADLSSVTIGGSVVGTRRITGIINSVGDLGPVKIGGDLRGGSISGTANQHDTSGYIHADRIVSVFIGGSIIAGTDTSSNGDLILNATILADDDIGSITVKGSLVGNEGDGAAGNITPVIIAARGQETLAPGAKIDVAIKSVSIGGHVSLAKILGGFDRDDPDTAGSNGNASIGVVKVGGDWFASSISAGVNAGNFGFGNPAGVIDNPPGAATDAIVARIASVVIKGSVSGPPNPFFQTGFVAQQIGSFKAAGFTAPLTAVTDPAISLTPYNVNVNLIELP